MLYLINGKLVMKDGDIAKIYDIDKSIVDEIYVDGDEIFISDGDIYFSKKGLDYLSKYMVDDRIIDIYNELESYTTIIDIRKLNRLNEKMNYFEKEMDKLLDDKMIKINLED